MFNRRDPREEAAETVRGRELLKCLPSVEAPASIWLAIERELRSNRRETPERTGIRRRWIFAFAVAVLCGAGITVWRPAVATIETNGGSTRTIPIGEIGSVELAPNTKIRVIAERPREHRLALVHGQIRAAISAPPRLFFVDTASGTAVDLGCEYTLSTDDAGRGVLQVTKGWVSFRWKEIESLVPAGASCRTWPHGGPSLPWFDDAPETFKGAAGSFGYEKSDEAALNAMLSTSRVRDTLTLWHLLFRVAPGDRERVFDRMAKLSSLPAGVTRERALKLDAETLNRWREELAWTW